MPPRRTARTVLKPNYPFRARSTERAEAVGAKRAHLGASAQPGAYASRSICNAHAPRAAARCTFEPTEATRSDVTPNIFTDCLQTTCTRHRPLEPVEDARQVPAWIPGPLRWRNPSRPRQPRRAASMVAMSIFFMGIIASKARFASPPPAASASVSARGVTCQERPQRSLHQPH
jgi:hypothetical protein